MIISPAILNTGQTHQSVSDRYTFVNTMDVVGALQDSGWNVVSSMQRSSRKDTTKLFNAHQVVLDHPDYTSAVFGGEMRPQINIFNSHDRSVAFSFYLGLIRFVCMNGLVVADSLFKSIKQKHLNIDTNELCYDIDDYVTNGFPKLVDSVHKFKDTKIKDPELIEFGTHAARLRWDNPTADMVEQIITPRRNEDTPTNLWNAYNMVQEHLITGGGVKAGKRTSRSINNILLKKQINTDLWELTDQYAEMYS